MHSALYSLPKLPSRWPLLENLKQINIINKETFKLLENQVLSRVNDSNPESIDIEKSIEKREVPLFLKIE